VLRRLTDFSGGLPRPAVGLRIEAVKLTCAGTLLLLFATRLSTLCADGDGGALRRDARVSFKGLVVWNAFSTHFQALFPSAAICQLVA
jgi:hypothetical protein